MKIHARRVTALLAGVLLLAACTTSAETPAPSGSSISTAASASVELGPDPGGDAYRTLDVCALVDKTVLTQPETSAQWADASINPIGPGICSVSNSTGWVNWSIGADRDQLPTALTAPNPVSETVETTDAGSVVIDAACATAYVVSRGYVINVDTSGVGPGICPLLKAVTARVRTSLNEGPPQLASAGGAFTAELCGRLAKTEMMSTAGLEVKSLRADHRVCEAVGPNGSKVRLITNNGTADLRRAKHVHGDIQVSPACAAYGLVADGPKGSSFWIRLALDIPPNTSCQGVENVLGKMVEQIIAGGQTPGA